MKNKEIPLGIKIILIIISIIGIVSLVKYFTPVEEDENTR